MADTTLSRRRMLALSGAALASLAGCTGSGKQGATDATATPTETTTATPTETGSNEYQPPLDFGDWFADTENFDGKVVDRMAQSEVTVTVGASDVPGGPMAFSPAAIRVSPDTTVVWRWTGAGSAHNVVDKTGGSKDVPMTDTDDAEFVSGKPVDKQGYTYSYTFEERKTHKYYCMPHRKMGMKGAVVVAKRFGGWFTNTENYYGVHDLTGHDTVTVTVGAPDVPGGPMAFSPAAIRVSPGTKVVWRWTGAGSAHNVVDKTGGSKNVPMTDKDDAEFVSGKPVDKKGYTFTHTFDDPGKTHKYYCMPHKKMGMKGVVEVAEQ